MRKLCKRVAVLVCLQFRYDILFTVEYGVV